MCLAYSWGSNWAIRTAFYWALTVGPLVLLYREQMRMIAHFVTHMRPFRSVAPIRATID
jgi:hypothetical protein